LIWKEQGSAIVGDNYTSDSLGYSVALSADAKTLVVGAPGFWGNSYREGHVKVYRSDEDSGNWTQLGQTIYGNATGDSFGCSVDISADGSTILLGSPQYSANYDRPGYVRVYSLTIDDEAGASTWKQIGLDIFGEAIGDQFGLSVSISGDGKTLAVGADSNDAINGENSGHVRIYRLENDGVSWEKVGDDIVGEVAGDLLGHSVSLSANGSIVETGAISGASNPFNGVRTGQVKVFRIDSAGSSWEQLGQSIYGDNVNDVFGWSVDISPDGYTLAIGSPGWFTITDRPGYVRVFSLEKDDEVGTVRWKRIGKDITGEADGDLCGWSVSLSDNASTLAVGAPYNDVNGGNSGLVRVYRIIDSESGWMKLNQTTKTRYKSKVTELEDEVFDVGALSDPAKFSKLLKSIENYIQKNYKTCNDIVKAIQQLKRPTLAYPKQPTRAQYTDANGDFDEDGFDMAKFAWKEDYKGMKYQMDKYNDNESNAWALIYDQCSPELKNKLEGTSGYDSAKSSNDIIKLLMIIRGTAASSTHSMMSTCRL